MTVLAPPRSAPTRTLTEAASLGTTPVSLEPYRSDAHFQAEIDSIFRRAWLLLARVEEIPQSFDFVVKPLDFMSTSVVLTRTPDGCIDGFFNVCSHRSNEVVLERSGNARRFICPYHAWTYRPDGSLATVPAERLFFDFDKSCNGLSKPAIEVWEGWIFVNVQARPDVSLRDFLGEMGDYLSGLPYNNAATPLSVRAELNCNWKLMADAFAESYHIPVLHPQTIGGMFAGGANASGKLLEFRSFGDHCSGSMYGDPNYTPDANRPLDAALYNQTDMARSGLAEDDYDAFIGHRAVNPTRREDWALDVNWIFPNTHIDTTRGGFLIHQFWPITKNRSRYTNSFYLPEPRTMRGKIQQEHFAARVIEIATEDLSNVERSQRAIDSGVKTVMHLQDNEVMIRHSLQAIDRWIREHREDGEGA